MFFVATVDIEGSFTLGALINCQLSRSSGFWGPTDAALALDDDAGVGVEEKLCSSQTLGEHAQRPRKDVKSNRSKRISVWGFQPEPAAPNVLHGSCCGAWLKLVLYWCRKIPHSCIWARVRQSAKASVGIWNVHRNGIRCVFTFAYFGDLWSVWTVICPMDSIHPKICSLCGLQCIPPCIPVLTLLTTKLGNANW